MIKKVKDTVFEMECKCVHKFQNVMRSLKNESGLTTYEILLILGLCVVVIGVTFEPAKSSIESWWDDNIATYWQ